MIFIIAHIGQFETALFGYFYYGLFKDEIIPIVDKRIQMFFVETAALFVTTEQSYIFAIANIIEDKVCDNVVTVLFLFWLVVLLIEFIFDLKHIKKIENDN